MKQSKTNTVAPKLKFAVGDSVIHTVPSMMYKRPGVITAFDKKRYNEPYWVVTYTNPKTGKVWNTTFAQFVLKKVPKGA